MARTKNSGYNWTLLELKPNFRVKTYGERLRYNWTLLELKRMYLILAIGGIRL